MSDVGEDPEGATPLGREELLGLRQSWIRTRADLNAAEAANVARGMAWARRQRRWPLLSDEFVFGLHRNMFGDVWDWAGTLRSRQTNVGVSPHEIRPALRSLLEEVQYWMSHASHPPDEIAIRLHHRMVLIHPFANGNGRHTRLMADQAAVDLGQRPFSWGGADLGATGQMRGAYISALRAADAHDIGPLLAFARA